MTTDADAPCPVARPISEEAVVLTEGNGHSIMVYILATGGTYAVDDAIAPDYGSLESACAEQIKTETVNSGAYCDRIAGGHGNWRAS